MQTQRRCMCLDDKTIKIVVWERRKTPTEFGTVSRFLRRIRYKQFLYLVKKVKALDSCQEGGRFDSFCGFYFPGFWNDADYRDYVDHRDHGMRDDVEVCVVIERAPWHVRWSSWLFRRTCATGLLCIIVYYKHIPVSIGGLFHLYMRITFILHVYKQVEY